MTKPVICGFDEAGRGPLAGPVTAACVILPSAFPLEVLGDSKALTARQRERAFVLIQEQAQWGLGWCSAAEIDQFNILQATLLAMVRSYEDLMQRFPNTTIDQGIVDGLFCPPLPFPATPLPKADSLVPSVSAASIVAKVSRDRFMEAADRDDPRYGFAKHKGYPTLAHRKALVRFGLGPLHRVSFGWKVPEEGE